MKLDIMKCSLLLAIVLSPACQKNGGASTVQDDGSSATGDSVQTATAGGEDTGAAQQADAEGILGSSCYILPSKIVNQHMPPRYPCKSPQLNRGDHEFCEGIGSALCLSQVVDECQKANALDQSEDAANGGPGCYGECGSRFNCINLTSEP